MIFLVTFLSRTFFELIMCHATPNRYETIKRIHTEGPIQIQIWLCSVSIQFYTVNFESLYNYFFFQIVLLFFFYFKCPFMLTFFSFLHDLNGALRFECIICMVAEHGIDKYGHISSDLGFRTSKCSISYLSFILGLYVVTFSFSDSFKS